MKAEFAKDDDMCERCGELIEKSDLPPTIRSSGFCARCIDEIWAADPPERVLNPGGQKVL